MYPKALSLHNGATGTVTTCDIAGFFTTFGLGGVFFTGCLTVYHLLVVRYQLERLALESQGPRNPSFTCWESRTL
jgi:hypothetical protein